MADAMAGAGEPAPVDAVLDAVGAAPEAAEASGGGVTQVLMWLMIFFIAWLAIQVLRPMMGGALKKRRQRGQALLVLGQSGSGKTLLFHRMRDGVSVECVSSLKENRDSMQVSTGSDSEPIGPIEVVDHPGHQRMRTKGLGLLAEARCIVYMIDSEDRAKMKDAAEHLYELLTHPDILDLHPPILLALNKCDLVSARTEKFILDELDREMEHMRFSRGATLEGQDSADSYLGIEGEKFKLLEHAPCPIRSCRVSVKKVQLEPIYDFLREHYS